MPKRRDRGAFRRFAAPFEATRDVGGDPFASVIAATPRALNHTFINLVEPGRSPLAGLRRILVFDEQLGTSRFTHCWINSVVRRRRCTHLAPFRSAFCAEVTRHERAALLVAEWVTIRTRKHSSGQSSTAHRLAVRSRDNRLPFSPLRAFGAPSPVWTGNGRKTGPLSRVDSCELVECQASERPREGRTLPSTRSAIHRMARSRKIGW